MKIFELIRIAFSSIISNKTRSLLTMLGLIIGISSVVTILAIGEGSQNSIEDNLGSLGLNNLSVTYERNVDLAPNEKFTSQDIDHLSEELKDDILTILPKYTGTGSIIGNIEESSISITGSNQHLKEADSLNIISGRSLMESDVTDRRHVIIIDHELSQELFATTNSIGEKILVKTGKNTNQFLIVGIYEKEDNSLGFSSSTAYMPYTTADKLLSKKGTFETFTITALEGVDIDLVGDKTLNILEQKHHNIGQDKYRYYSLSSQIEMVSDVMGQVTLLISAIAGISLVVGGIGVMNIMLVSVTERTREIGIRKALGAKREDILIQFLVEAVSICIIGGFIGIGFGILFTELAEKLMGTPMNISLVGVLLATTFSMVIGVVFGVYPANKASKLDPITALRYE